MKAMLDSLVVIKLNGGLGTSMGCRYQGGKFGDKICVCQNSENSRSLFMSNSVYEVLRIRIYVFEPPDPAPLVRRTDPDPKSGSGSFYRKP